jgi:predicted dehydrogenase
MIKIGVLGAGHLGKIHLRLLKEIPTYDLVGFYDPDNQNAQYAEQEFGIKRYPYLQKLIEDCDAIDIVTPTVSHFESAVSAIRSGKHIFIEKPVTQTVEEAKKLIKLSEEAGIKIQVGHVERFNPAFLSLEPYNLKPMFIESHRLSQFNPRGTDVSVILDLMIHDLDIILSIVNSEVKDIQASGVAVVSKTPDIANARISFINGCVANVTASRISLKNMRKMRLFQKDAYISMDFLEKKSQIVRLTDTEDKDDPLAMPINTESGTIYKKVDYREPEVEPVNSIKMELEYFEKSISNDKPTAVSIIDGYKAIKLANEIYNIFIKNQINQ